MQPALAAPHGDQTGRPRPIDRRGRLFRKYVAVLVILVSGGLLTSSAFNLYSAWQGQRAIRALQAEAVEDAADRVGQFVLEIVEQVIWAVEPIDAAGAEAGEERRHAYRSLLRLAPAVTRITHRDCRGGESLVVSRIAMDQVGPEDPACATASMPEPRPRMITLGPVTFPDGYPHVDVTVVGAPSAGATIVQVNLTYASDVVSDVKIGPNACAYLLDRDGTLIAHPDPDLVRDRPNVASLDRVCTGVGSGARRARAGVERAVAERVHGLLYGERLFRAYSPIAPPGWTGEPLGWTVALEQPAQAALAQLLSSLLTTAVLLAVGLVLSVLASLLLARRMVTPIQALRAGAERIGAGDLDHRIEVSTGDELESLADSFNRMGAQLQRGRELDAQNRLFQQGFPPQVARIIIEAGGEGLESHEREITAVFCDLRGYTAFAETARPQHLMQMLEEYYQALGQLITRYDGTLERFTGDGVMVFFNDPVPQEDHAERAVRMALEMRDELRCLTEKWRQLRDPYVHGFGIGIDLGVASLGRIGFKERYDYAALGPVINCAARLCSLAADGQLLISQAVYAVTADLVEVEYLGPRELKGFRDPIRVYNVLRPK
ncbi:MAG: HAMP domain-containing protein [Chloroflexota bacterium]|nr:HAMP domain-containing protein [Chloroflexota bacterium]